MYDLPLVVLLVLALLVLRVTLPAFIFESRLPTVYVARVTFAVRVRVRT